jgi:hypothetical protein
MGGIAVARILGFPSLLGLDMGNDTTRHNRN